MVASGQGVATSRRENSLWPPRGEMTSSFRAIHHIKLFHPSNDHYGLSPLEAAASAIDRHNTASK